MNELRSPGNTDAVKMNHRTKLSIDQIKREHVRIRIRIRVWARESFFSPSVVDVVDYRQVITVIDRYLRSYSS